MTFAETYCLLPVTIKVSHISCAEPISPSFRLS
nr:MAG TPA: hypothetical protein [Caudoviricetes sp.]